MQVMKESPIPPSAHSSHIPSLAGASNARALKIAGWLTGIYFSTIQVEIECLEQEIAKEIDF